MSNSYKFIHFGCWGKKKIVVSKLVDVTESKDYAMVSVAGDNYYPEKKYDETQKIEYKVFNPIHFNMLFELLCKLKTSQEKGVKLIFGNHDINDIVSYNNDEGMHTIECNTLIKTIEFINNVNNNCNNVSFFTDVMFNIDAPNTLVIFLDTTVYESKKLQYKCYSENNIFSNEEDNNITTSEELREYQNQRVKEIIDKYPDRQNIILVGHHPLVSYKDKKTTMVESYSGLLIEFFYNILNVTKSGSKKIYYLCADTHFYEKSTILISDNKNENSIKIEQYIVGTGGADLDNPGVISGQQNIKINKLNISFERMEAVKDYGYLDCLYNLSDNEWKYNFIPVKNDID